MSTAEATASPGCHRSEPAHFARFKSTLRRLRQSFLGHLLTAPVKGKGDLKVQRRIAATFDSLRAQRRGIARA